MANQVFSQEYSESRDLIVGAAQFYTQRWAANNTLMVIANADRPMRDLRRAFLDLPRVLTAGGFNYQANGVLDRFRATLANASRGQPEGVTMFEMLGYDATQFGQLPQGLVRVTAALKLLRHTYRVQQAGGQTIWVVSLPVGYERYPQDEFEVYRQNRTKILSLLNETDEMFGVDQRAKLGAVTLQAHRWCNVAQQKLGMAAAGDAREIKRVRRWFAGKSYDDAYVRAAAQRLQVGFRRIADRISQNVLIYTDRPAGVYRSTAIAYVLPTEPVPTVYVPRRFFSKHTTQRKWPLDVEMAMAVVHELSHRVMLTDDHKYRHRCMGVRASFTAAEAEVNADSWALYAADAAGKVSSGQARWALTGHYYSAQLRTIFPWL